MSAVPSGVAAIQARIAQIDPGVTRRAAPAATTPSVASTSFDTLLASVSSPSPALASTAGPALVSASATGSIGSIGAIGSPRPGGPYADLFAAAGARHGVDPNLLSAVAWAESGYRPDAVSPAGAQGLMQLMPGTAQGLGVQDPFDPAQAVDGAARLLAGHLRKYQGSVPLALAAYNAGPGAVARHGGVPPYAETQAYIAKIQQRLTEVAR